MIFRTRYVWICVLCVMTLWSACGGGDPATLTVSVDQKEVAAGEKVNLTIVVKNFTLTDPLGGSTAPSAGFYRVFLDESTKAIAEGFAAKAEVTLPSDVKEGAHKLRVALYKVDKTPVTPTVEASVDISVKAAKKDPSVTVQALTSNKVKPGEQITLSVKVTNFTLKAPASNTVNKPNEGHFHVSLDDDDPEQTYLAVSHEETVKVTIPLSITAGPHKLVVTLMNNNHSKATPATTATVAFEVTQAAPPTLEVKSNKSTVSPGDVVVLDISVTNFKLTKIVDSPTKKVGEGHYHVLLGDGDPEDSKAYIAADSKSKLELTLPNSTPLGKQKLVVYLMNSDHTKYDPETKASVEIEVVGKEKPVVNATIASKDVVAGKEFELKISTKNFKLTQISNSPTNKAGEGHYHVVLDDADPEKDYVTPDYRETIKVTLPKSTKPGPHKLHVYLMNNDHTKYKPEGKATLEINVLEAGSPSIVSFKADKVKVKPGDKLTTTIEVANFVLKAISGSPTNKAGEGHYHLSFDANDPEKTYVAATHEKTYTITIPGSLTPGKHKLFAYLMNNDHTKVTPEVKVSIEFEVVDD